MKTKKIELCRKNKLVQYYVKKDLPQKQMIWIYHRFLEKDKRWHFFHEGSYCLIRTSQRVLAMERYLRNQKLAFDIGVWEDAHETVRKYQPFFEPVFHSYTILGLIGKNSEFNSLMNRVVHCFINMCGAPHYEECFALQRQATQSALLYAQGCGETQARRIVDEFRAELKLKKIGGIHPYPLK